ncbi:M23 family metallopeptidase [Nitrosococcus wardiae]|uniref:M23 family metallopeptidase n=1 Tax=Nitrosococcus wardiae TaxID=1814290 RepID=A0A4P7C103_9GAMM|nr:M23 family metallopeptidase [Nitrosococcus wardiae]QBQ54552.1 M23 family metallopeptidase [Nitrosococcus wardiae]
MHGLTGLLGFGLLLLSYGWAAELALEFHGPLQQGSLLIGKTEPGIEVFLDGRQLRVSEDGLFLMGFGRDAKPEATLKLVFPDGTHEVRELEIAQRQYQTQHIEGLPPRKVTPRTEDLVRIRKEAAWVRKARELDDPRTDFLSGFIWPVQGAISGVYGSQRILNGQPRRPHYGIDIAAPTGTPVRAPSDGLVTLVHPDMFFSGGTLILDHGHGLSSAFLHLRRILVEEGERVTQGEIIAEVGATGRVTGAHLDWRINLFQTRLDPQLLVAPMPTGARE